MDTNKEAVAIFDKLASQYQDKFMDVGIYQDSLERFCNELHRNGASVLDIACGPGNITKYLLNKRPDLNILGIDLAPNMVALAAINNPGAVFRLLDSRNISTLGSKYDGVVCAFCLPYLSEEEVVHLINDVAKLLNPDGVFYISTMEEDEYNHSGYKMSSSGDQMYIHYHTGSHLIAALQANELKIIDTQRITYSTNGENVTDLIIIAGK